MLDWQSRGRTISSRRSSNYPPAAFCRLPTEKVTSAKCLTDLPYILRLPLV